MENIWVKRSLALVTGFTLFRVFLMGLSGLGDSESYYWTWSRHLDWSYFDHPPVVAYLIRFSTAIGGDSAFVTRLPAAILFVGICFFMYRIAVQLFDEKTGFWALMIFNLCPLFSVAGLQIVPDIPAVFFWSVFVYLVILILKEDRPMLWYPVGAVVGLGLLSKYLVLPLIPATLVMLGWHSEYRKHLKQPHIYLGGLLGLLIFSPVLIWNYLNEFPSFRFHLDTRHGDAGSFNLKHWGEFLGGQGLYLSPLIWFGLLYVVYRCGKSLFKDKDMAFATLFWYSALPLAFFYYIGLWTNDSEPHWPAFGYITPIIAWAAYYARNEQNWRKYTFSALAISGAMILAFYIHVFVPILPIKPKYDIVNELYGWDKVGPVIEKMYGELPADNEKFIMANHWLICSQTAHSIRNRLTVYCLNNKVDQFDFFPDTNPPPGGNFIFVTDSRFNHPPEKFYDFERVDEPRVIEQFRGGKQVRTFYIYSAYGFKGQKK